MNKRKCNIADWQASQVAKRSAFIKKAVALNKGRSFDSYNAFATYLATALTEFERMQAQYEYELHGKKGKFKTPKPVSRQVFFRNKAYRAIAEAAYTGRKIEGVASIKNPKTPSEIDAVLTQKDFTISELNAEIERLRYQLKRTNLSAANHDALEHSDYDYSSVRQEKSKTIQAVINILRWADGLLGYDQGQVTDRGARGDKAIIVERQLLKHCARTIDEALKGFTVDK